MPVSTIRVAGRATQGVKLINIKEGDSIAAVSVVAHSEDEPDQTEIPPVTEEENTNN
jgi:DNA gyrase subunit A